MKIKTIDINAKDWFDKVNGNSYFSTEIILNYCLDDQRILECAFQYGYGEHYIFESFKEICETFGIKTDLACWNYCKQNNIILRTNKQENCLKRELIQWENKK